MVEDADCTHSCDFVQNRASIVVRTLLVCTMIWILLDCHQKTHLDWNLLIAVVNQPSNSPDLNICALQTAYFKDVADEIPQFIQKVQNAFDEYPQQKINKAFLTLICCKNEIIKANGSNETTRSHTC